MNMKILRTLSEPGKIIKLGSIPGTFADGIPLAGTSRALWLLGESSARVPEGALRGCRPPHCWWRQHGLDHLRTKGTGTGITPCTLYYPLRPGSIRYDVADVLEG